MGVPGFNVSVFTNESPNSQVVHQQGRAGFHHRGGYGSDAGAAVMVDTMVCYDWKTQARNQPHVVNAWNRYTIWSTNIANCFLTIFTM